MLKSLLRSFFWLCLLSVATLVVILYFIPRLLPEDQLRSTFVHGYENRTGRKMTLGGFAFALIPNPYVSASDISISDPATPDAPPLLIPAMRIDLNLLDLLSNRITASFRAGFGQQGGVLQEFSGMASFPTIAKHNRGGENLVQLELTAPFPFLFRGRIRADNEKLVLTNAELTLGGTHGTGGLEGSVSQSGDSYKGQWQFSSIDVEGLVQAWPQLMQLDAGAKGINEIIDYLLNPKAPTDIVAERPVDDKTPWLDRPVPLGWIMLLSADIGIKADRLSYHGVTHQNIIASVEAKNGVANLDIKDGIFFGGKGEAALTIDVFSEKVPLLRNRMALKGGNVGQLLRDVYQPDLLDGTGDLTVEAMTTGGHWRDIIGSLSGKGSISMKDGLLKHIDILGMANPTPEVIRKAIYETDTDTKVTDLNASFSMTEGILANNDLILNVPFVRLTGRGTIDLLEQSIKYRIAPVVGVNRIGLSVPLLLEGSLKHPTVLPDVSGIVTQGVDDIILRSAPVKAVTDTVGRGLKAVPGVKQVIDALPGGELKRAPKQSMP